jgi:serine/threonine protein kinase
MLDTCIGRGAYCEVWRATNRDGYPVAIKFYIAAFHDCMDARRILREIQITSSFTGHPQLVQVIDAIVPTESEFTSIAIVYLLHGVSMCGLVSFKSGLTLNHVWHILYQTICGLRAIHSADVAMCDMKPSNLLINERCEVAICDFNLSLALPVPKSEKDMLRMTIGYRAPECIMRAPLTGENARAIDIWGLGCIFAELLLYLQSGLPQTLMRAYSHSSAEPSPHLQFAKMFTVIGTPGAAGREWLAAHQPEIATYWAGKVLPPQLESMFPSNPLAVALLTRMLAFDPAERPTAEMLYRDLAFREFRRECPAPVFENQLDLSWIDELQTPRDLRDGARRLISAVHDLVAGDDAASDASADAGAVASDDASGANPSNRGVAHTIVSEMARAIEIV